VPQKSEHLWWLSMTLDLHEPI